MRSCGQTERRLAMFYFLGSILFALAMMAAFAVMADNFAR